MLRAADDATCQTGVTLLTTVLGMRFSLSDVSPPLTLVMHAMQAACNVLSPDSPKSAPSVRNGLGTCCLLHDAFRHSRAFSCCTLHHSA